MTLALELGQVSDPYTRRALEQISLRWQVGGTSTGGGGASTVTVVNSLPATGSDGDAVFLTTDSSEYIYSAGAWRKISPGPQGTAGPAGTQGPPGPTGADSTVPGPQGPQGPPGAANAAYTGLWRWTTSTTTAGTSGDVGINTGAWNTATQVNISKTTYGGTDVANGMLKLKVGDGFYIQDKADATKYGEYTISGAGTDHGTWWSFPVTLARSGGTPPANNADTNVSLLGQGAQVEEWIGGAGAPASGLGKIGDWYLDQTGGNVYEKTTAAVWTLRTNIIGPQGIQGPQGNAGAQGVKGDTGATGSQGPQGNTGTQGPQGNPGTPGEKWFTGSGAPAGATGIVGDWYVDSATGDYYEKTGASAWTLRGNLKGPQGIQGIQGIQGVQGNTGSAGTPGSIWRSGTGAPAGALGVVGDWYENDATGDIYEKTGASTYTLRDNLTGPQGIQGNPGAGAPDATTTTKGSIQLAGDLAGTAAAPQIAALAVTDAEVAAANKDGAAATASMRTLGTGAQQAAAGNDARFTNARTPTAHASTHQPGGSDPMAVDAVAATGSLRTLGTGAAQAAAGNDARFTDSRPPSGTAGGDLSGSYPNPQIATGVIVDADVATANKDGLANVPSMRTIGAGATQVVAGNDVRLTNARAPTAHAATHQPGGSDPMAVDAAAATGSLRTLGAGAAQACAGNDARLSRPPRVSSLPGSPVDGQECYYAADATNGILWHLRYNAGSASAYKWEFVGGGKLFSLVAAQEATTSATYAALATAGPSITIPLAGDYEIEIGANLQTPGGGTVAYMSFDVGATAAVDADSLDGYTNTGSMEASMWRSVRKTVAAAATAITAKYKTTASTAFYQRREMRITPVRVG